ncbi:signal transduction histidine kinase [Neolewinella xylanilytica]|uniref:histidine kinase n=1 Tax=Neolewinella xylanilytica TaxID=1514080 RepID=A0A2S6I4W6_9BACT|nr:hybrid sensor histidine kinase/response regulator transcription factor [Neolewinella xylanilytica]PPK86149.1 signal transduction histidine kinase [Neolewinella xylanilytica]
MHYYVAKLLGPRALLALLLWWPPYDALSAQQPFPFQLQYLTTDDGLAQNTVDALLRDSDGFMWFATWNGLSRYDGYGFENYRSQPEEAAGLPDNGIHALAEDHDRKIWIGTAKGLAVYDMERARFVSFGAGDPILRTADISALYTDSSGSVWVATKYDGLYVLTIDPEDPATIRVATKFRMPPPAGSITSLTGGNQNTVIIGTTSGVFTSEGEELSRLPGAAGSLNATTLYHDGAELWIGTHTGLIRYGWADRRITAFVHDPQDEATLLHNTVTSICRDVEGNLLVGTLGGISYFQPLRGDFRSLTQRGAGAQELNNRFVNALLTDTLGNVWIGTDKGGVNKYNLHQHRFGALTHQAGKAGTLSHPTVNSVLEEGNTLWVGTAGGGLNRIDRKSGTVRHYTHDPKATAGISSDFVTAILRGQGDDLWLGTWGAGVNRMNTRNGRFEPFLVGKGQHPTNSVRFISSLHADPRGFLLIGSEEGLATVDPETGELLLFTGDHPLATIREVGCILLDAKNVYWIGTRKALFRFPASALDRRGESIKPDDIERYTRTSGEGLPGDYILSLREDHRGRIWVGTYGRGLAVTPPPGRNKPAFTAYDEGDGLGNNVVYTIEIDDRGYLWLGTDHGLSSLNPETITFKNYYRADGLLSNQFYWSASHRGSDGYLYFGSVEGLNYFRPSAIGDYPDPAPAVLTSLQILNEPVGVGQAYHGTVPLPTVINRADEVRLSYRDNVFSLTFSALDYFLPEQTRFAYRMVGVDKDWVIVGADRRFATYTNLGGGEYTFEVKASNGHGSWQPAPTRLRFVILPPFYQTAWFRILIGVLLVGAVFCYMRWRFNFLRKQTKKLEGLVSVRTAEIERQKAHLHATNTTLAHRQKEIAEQKDELEFKNREISQQRDRLIELNKQVREVNQTRLRFFTNISHEFRTPLTLILDPLEGLLERFDHNEEVKHRIRIVNRNAQRLLHLINQLMSFRRIEEGQQVARITRGDVVHFVKEIFLSFQDLAHHQQIDYRFALTNPRQQTWFDAEKLEHILYNLLSNALKFTPKGGQVSLELRFLDSPGTGETDPHLEIAVRDTGIGIAKSDQPLVFDHFYQVSGTGQHSMVGSGIGLALVRELVQLMHGSIQLESEVGKGATFTVRLPYLRRSFLSAEIADTSPGAPSRSVLPNRPLPPPGTPEPTPAPPKRKDAPLVLVVEDNADLRFLLTQRLGKKYRIVVAEDGVRGRELAEAEAPDLIISDIMMPRMDGIELCRHLKTDITTSHIPVILLTAKAMVENFVEGLETGADDYVAKPFNLKILTARIDNLIRTRRRLRKLFGKQATPPPQTATPNPVDQRFLQAVYDVLEENYARPDFNQQHLAEALFISRSLLYKKIKSLTDRSVTDFVNFFKLEKARHLLAAERMTIAEIAYQCGFSDPKYFSRVFRKAYGYPPSEYLQRNVSPDVIDPAGLKDRLN